MEWAMEMIRENIIALGEPVTITGTESVETRAIIVPEGSVSKEARTTQTMADGRMLPGTYQMFVLPEIRLEDAETVVARDRRYLVRRTDIYRCADRDVYGWALMIRGGNVNEGT